jgi:hypothetical protein
MGIKNNKFVESGNDEFTPASNKGKNKNAQTKPKNKVSIRRMVSSHYIAVLSELLNRLIMNSHCVRFT